MKTTRLHESATLLKDGRVLVVGDGFFVLGPDAVTGDASAELYDPATGTFTLTGSPHMASGSGVPFLSVLLQSGRVLVIGCDLDTLDAAMLCTSALAEVYDPATGLFSRVGPIPGNYASYTATVLNDGRVLVACGGDAYGRAEPSLLFDPATAQFTTTGMMTTAQLYPTATLLSDGRVLFAGGVGALASQSLASAELYDPKTGTFTPTGSMATARALPTATLLPDGRVLIAGGEAESGFLATGRILDSAELYDPKTGTFTPTGSMSSARVNHTATRLSDGRVLVAGGYLSPYVNLDSAELYDPKTGTFTPTGSMSSARVNHTATRLSDGRVLIAGGYNRVSGQLRSAELYQP